MTLGPLVIFGRLAEILQLLIIAGLFFISFRPLQSYLKNLISRILVSNRKL